MVSSRKFRTIPECFFSFIFPVYHLVLPSFFLLPNLLLSGKWCDSSKESSWSWGPLQPGMYELRRSIPNLVFIIATDSQPRLYHHHRFPTSSLSSPQIPNLGEQFKRTSLWFSHPVTINM
jgi:hypothetical protein